MALNMSKPKPAPASPAAAATDPYGGALEQTMVRVLKYDVISHQTLLHNACIRCEP